MKLPPNDPRPVTALTVAVRPQTPMNKRIIIFFLSFLCVTSSWAQESNILSALSPKLRKFLTEQPAAFNKLTNAVAHTFPGKTVHLFYFYSDDESKPRAFHYYPGTIGLADVVICIRENQHSLDEFIAILFESLNARGEVRFSKLTEDARAGKISKTEFARGVLKTEFEACKLTRDWLSDLKVSEKDMLESYYYRRFVECPNDFDAFLLYAKKASPNRNAIKEYELQYDALRKQ